MYIEIVTFKTIYISSKNAILVENGIAKSDINMESSSRLH